MPRTTGSKNKSTGSRFKPFEGRFPEDRHLRLTKDMLMDTKYKKLSPGACKLYQYLKMWASGQTTVTFASSMMKDIMSREAFIRARNELVEAGFIDWLNPGLSTEKRHTGEYELSDRWWRGSKL